MDKFCSALVINRKLFPDVHQVIRPRYNKEYFKRLSANIDSLKEHTEARCKSSSDRLDETSLTKFKADTIKLLELKNLADRVKDEDRLRSTLEQIEAVEARVLPTVVSIPNRCSKNVPQTDIILGQVRSDWSRDGVTKMLSHTKLSYINDCYSKSVVGSNSSYYFGIAAKLQYGIRDYFAQSLEEKAFIPVSGLCLTKSAVVEAVNSQDHKNFFNDPCRILKDESRFTTTHLVEASRESLIGFLITLGHRSSTQPLRLLTSGSSYCIGSDWFDSDDKRASQFETVHTLIHALPVEKYSMTEYLTVRDIIWDLYTKLGLPVRLVHCSLSSMRSNEYDTHRIDIWLPSRSQWIETARISHYFDYLTIRTGMKRGHLIDSKVYDSRALIAAIIENNQTSTGKFVIPTVIEDYMPYMEESEKNSYLREKVSNSTKFEDTPPISNAFSNYQQRRYLAKKSYLFASSKRDRKNETTENQREKLLFCAALCMIWCLLDWESIWVDHTPWGAKRFLYDYIYRPARRIYWSFVYVGDNSPPPDEPFDEMDHSHFHKDLTTRRKEVLSEKYLPKGRLDPSGKNRFEVYASQDKKVSDTDADRSD